MQATSLVLANQLVRKCAQRIHSMISPTQASYYAKMVQANNCLGLELEAEGDQPSGLRLVTHPGLSFTSIATAVECAMWGGHLLCHRVPQATGQHLVSFTVPRVQLRRRRCDSPETRRWLCSRFVQIKQLPEGWLKRHTYQTARGLVFQEVQDVAISFMPRSNEPCEDDYAGAATDVSNPIGRKRTRRISHHHDGLRDEQLGMHYATSPMITSAFLEHGLPSKHCDGVSE